MLRLQPSLGCVSTPKSARDAEQPFRHHFEHSHHAEKRVTMSQNCTGIKSYVLSDSSNFMDDGIKFLRLRHGLHFAQIEKYRQSILSHGILFQGVKVMNYLFECDIPKALGSDDPVLGIDVVRDWQALISQRALAQNLDDTAVAKSGGAEGTLEIRQQL
jgi:hypothetical protein